MTKRNIPTRNFAKTLRTEQTPPEAMLWNIIRAKRLGGVKFVRQLPIAPYVADFAARDARLVIELDGDSHIGRDAYDAERTAFIEDKGYRVIRFTNREILNNPQGVARAILVALGRDPG